MKALLLLLSVGKLGKFLLSGGTMLLSLVTYSFVFGWRYALGFVFLLLIHEMGHYIAAKKSKLSVGLPTFIPFVGAWIELKEQIMNPETEAFVGLAGPMLGSAAAFLCYVAAREFASPLLMAIAYAGFMLNLFNLIPLSPLDGGRIVAVISPRLWMVGIPILGALFIWKPSPMLILVGLLALPHLWALRRKSLNPAPTLPLVNQRIKIKYGIEYLLLTAFLAILSFEAHQQLSYIKN
jgi:Zn-dependent protease